jgi:hypothetical protein
MSIGKILLYTALAVAVVSLLTSDKAKETSDQIKDEIKDQALKNAKKWKEKMNKLNQDGVKAIANV